MIIEVLYFDGCPNHDRLLERLPRLLEREGIAARIVLCHVSDDEQAQREQFLGSPTIRVNGRDIEPGAADRTDYGLGSPWSTAARRCRRATSATS